eukprot:gnl/TRDRNA2_/TRDRNA2_32364_c0_seq1.p1 gnl/TRDRNA2_/TRDRNA2_32364_c0~~gnl/TRDRNA2_/TRDRNA2_32364_c0_seq1.p1  ORF type:complete len:285 (-),score=37.68 gnl/TRDRNA2_/TRDRNA2_32364_c0_seq1:90-908(-)
MAFGPHGGETQIRSALRIQVLELERELAALQAVRNVEGSLAHSRDSTQHTRLSVTAHEFLTSSPLTSSATLGNAADAVGCGGARWACEADLHSELAQLEEREKAMRVKLAQEDCKVADLRLQLARKEEIQCGLQGQFDEMRRKVEALESQSKQVGADMASVMRVLEQKDEDIMKARTALQAFRQQKARKANLCEQGRLIPATSPARVTSTVGARSPSSTLSRMSSSPARVTLSSLVTSPIMIRSSPSPTAANIVANGAPIFRPRPASRGSNR